MIGQEILLKLDEKVEASNRGMNGFSLMQSSLDIGHVGH